MNYLLRITVILWLANFPLSSHSQVSISFYSSSLSKVGIAFDFSDRIWSEMRIYSNTSFENITPELVLCFNMAKAENHNVYLGVGANINYFTGPVLPLGIRFNPFENFKRFSLHIELQPSLNFNGADDLILQGSWGIRYKFAKE